jgi:hypothetical protein
MRGQPGFFDFDDWLKRLSDFGSEFIQLDGIGKCENAAGLPGGF